MPIHRQFTASCDVCQTQFIGSGTGYTTCVEGKAYYSDHLKEALLDNRWKVSSSKVICPCCLEAMASEAITIKQATSKEQ